MSERKQGLTGLDLLQVMVDQEEMTSKLYRQIANQAKKGDGFFERLAEDEDRHKKIYEGLLRRYEKERDSAFHKEVSEEDYHYLQSLVDNDALNNREEYLTDATKIGGRMAIYDLAIRLEQDTVSFVTELERLYRDAVPEEFSIIIKEEKEHLQKVRQRKLDFAMAGRGL